MSSILESFECSSCLRTLIKIKQYLNKKSLCLIFAFVLFYSYITITDFYGRQLLTNSLQLIKIKPDPKKVYLLFS